MATLDTRYVVTGGANGDGSFGSPWSTMDNARAGLEALYPSGLVVADVQVDLVCSGSTQDTAPNTSTGVNWTILTDATRYIRIFSGAGNQPSAAGFDTGKYRLVQTNGFRPCMTLATAKMIVFSIQLRNTGARANNPKCIQMPSAAGREHYIYGCYGDFTAVDAAGSEAIPFYLSNTGSTHKLVIRNCIARGGRFGIKRSGSASGAVTIVDNNTCVDGTTGLEVALAAGSNLWMRNNVCANNSGTDYVLSSSGGTNVFSGNRAEDTTSPDAAGAGDSQTFVFVNAGTGDYRLDASDTGAQGQGTDLSADAQNPFSTDIDANTRTVPWDSGAHQYTPAGPTYYDAEVIIRASTTGSGSVGNLLAGGLIR